jgi:hypothetical protein
MKTSKPRRSQTPRIILSVAFSPEYCAEIEREAASLGSTRHRLLFLAIREGLPVAVAKATTQQQQTIKE